MKNPTRVVQVVVGVAAAILLLMIGAVMGEGDLAEQPGQVSSLSPVTITQTVTETLPPKTVTKTKTAKVTVTKTKTVTVSQGAAESQQAVPPGSGGGNTYYANCSEARAAGAAPLHRGEPGYASHLDRDNDGVACE